MILPSFHSNSLSFAEAWRRRSCCSVSKSSRATWIYKVQSELRSAQPQRPNRLFKAQESQLAWRHLEDF